MYPRVQRIKEFHGDIKSVANRFQMESDLLVLDYESMQAEALSFYMESFKAKLCTFDLSASCNVEMTTEKIVKIFIDLKTQFIREENNQQSQHINRPCRDLNVVSTGITLLRAIGPRQCKLHHHQVM